MPPPIVTFTIAAASPNTPMARTRPLSASPRVIDRSWCSGRFEVFQDLFGVLAGRHLRVRLTDAAVLADDVADPLRGAGGGAVGGAVGHADLPLGVAQERVVELELL